MNLKVPKYVQSEFDGFSFLIDFHARTKGFFLQDITLDFSETSWFDANLLAGLGAILSRLEDELNHIRIINLPSNIATVFKRNQFLSHFGGYKIQDFYRTIVRYAKFKSSDEQVFKIYLEKELLSIEGMSNMSGSLRKKVNESIFEIFNNAIIHGGCTYVFSCGQHFPKKRRLDFAVADLGATIKKNVCAYLNKDLTGEEAIKWAVTEKHTTKTGPIPGGLGLKLIREFIAVNKGRMQIVSADGFWEQRETQINSATFQQEFPGTIVNLEFNIDKNYSYGLSSEIDTKNIF
ncbi:MAG: ATP-binding protein [Calditrichaeota bacterium]|nr:MAG: ATP-binding protein [Calditrichota bacterium]